MTAAATMLRITGLLLVTDYLKCSITCSAIGDQIATGDDSF